MGEDGWGWVGMGGDRWGWVTGGNMEPKNGHNSGPRWSPKVHVQPK